MHFTNMTVTNYFTCHQQKRKQRERASKVRALLPILRGFFLLQ